MYKILSYLAFSLFTICLLLAVLFNIDSFASEIIATMNIWAQNVFPTLFPFFVISSLILHLGVAFIFSEIVGPFLQLIYKSPKIGGFVFITGLISGSPNTAKIVSELVKQELLTIDEANNLLAFCTFINPMFILATTGVIYLQSIELGLILLIIHILSNLLLGIFLSFTLINKRQLSIPNPMGAFKNMHEYRQRNKLTFGSILTQAIRDSINVLLLIGGFMLFFKIVMVTAMFFNVTEIMYSFGSPIFKLFGIEFTTFNNLFQGLLELVTGIGAVSNSADNELLKIIIISIILAFGSLSIHMQLYSFIKSANLSYGKFMLARIAQAFVAAAISFPIYSLLKFPSSYVLSSTFSFIQKYHTVAILVTILALVLYIVIINFTLEEIPEVASVPSEGNQKPVKR